MIEESVPGMPIGFQRGISQTWNNKIFVDNCIYTENIDRDVNHLDNQKHLCRELLLGCTKPMDNTASNGP